MANYVYGIVEEAAEAPTQSGIGGAPVQTVQAHGAAALVSELPADEQLEFGREELLAHERVLEAALDHGTVLPMRFGIVLEGSEVVRSDLLEAHADELHRQLEEMAGKVEIRIRATYDEAAIMREIIRENPDVAQLRQELQGQPEDATYFARLHLGEMVSAALERRRELDAEAIVGELGQHAVATAVGQASHERIVFAASFLIDRADRERFEQAVEKVAAAQAERMRVTFSDPLPPHSFVQSAGSS